MTEKSQEFAAPDFPAIVAEDGTIIPLDDIGLIVESLDPTIDVAVLKYGEGQ